MYSYGLQNAEKFIKTSSKHILTRIKIANVLNEKNNYSYIVSNSGFQDFIGGGGVDPSLKCP